MSKIKILPPDLVNKIAAGEVVERPASVVKELVENSIDAGASRITIEIQDAGKKLIRVIDDGSGMTDEDIKLALERHSTSKISSVDDLFNIKTLGFRGEALPSIASVSRTMIERNASGKGVTAAVKDLFHNTPVRLKFLKSNYTELSHVQGIVTRFIICNPGIAFDLIVDGKEIARSPGNGKLFDSVFSVYGLDIAKELVEVKGDKVFGFVSKPTVSRLDRGYETFFVNGRSVQNFLLGRAVEDACRNLIPSNRYPVAILFVIIPPAEVDVNVHPSKREVKFLKTKDVMDAVREAVKAALSEFHETGSWQENSEYQMTNDKLIDQLPMTNIETGVVTQTFTQEFEVTDVQPLIPLYVLEDTYIVATDGADLVLIDQHAAHERVLYDKLSEQWRVPACRTGRDSEQALLVPEAVEFNSADAKLMEEKLSELKALGFDLEVFGKDSFLVRSVPSFLVKEPIKGLLLDLLSEFKSDEYRKQTEKREERINKFLACRGAVKAGDKLSQAEISGLIRDLYRTTNPMTCPHGRPTLVRISSSDLSKLFRRT